MEEDENIFLEVTTYCLNCGNQLRFRFSGYEEPKGEPHGS